MEGYEFAGSAGTDQQEEQAQILVGDVFSLSSLL